MPTPRVIDLSHHNSIPRDLTAAAAAGIIGVIHKMTEGSSYVDDHAEARFYLAGQAGMRWGLYHFLRPGDMEQQAQHFIDAAQDAGVIDRDTLLAADHEDPKVSYDDLMDFLIAVENITGRIPKIYSGHVIKDQCGSSSPYPNKYPLWLANYASSPTLPHGCQKYYLWQYTDQGSIAGVTPPTDLNQIQPGVTDAEFMAMWSGGDEPVVEPEPPEPEVEPEPPVAGEGESVTITIRIDAPPGSKVTVT
jgi:lysozyme